MAGTADNMMAEAKAHPYIMAGGALVIVLIIWYVMASSSSSTGSTATAPDDTATTDAAQLAAAQAAANATLAGDQLAAGVANNQTAATQTLGLANIAGQVSVDNNQTAAAQAVSLAQIGANLTASLAQTSAQTQQTYSTNSTAIALGAESGIVDNIASITSSLNDYLSGSAAQQSGAAGQVLYTIAKGSVEPADAMLSTMGLTATLQAGGNSANVNEDVSMSGDQPIVQNYSVASGNNTVAAAPSGYTVQQ